MNIKSQSQHQFSMVPQIAGPGRSTFDRSHIWKNTLNEGLLYPCYYDEALPGDTFHLNTTIFGRLATPITPIMDNLWVDTHYFAVPFRLLWDNFQKFMGEQENPGDSTDFLIPQLHTDETTPGVVIGSIHDSFGLPYFTSDGGADNPTRLSVSALYHRAYNLIWNQWFRDENLQDSVTVNKGDGPDTLSMYRLLPRNKRPDYFTTCLPWPQKGPGAMLPLTGSVVGNGTALGLVGNNFSGALAGDLYGATVLAGTPSVVSLATDNYGADVGHVSTNHLQSITMYSALGVTSDPTKSGLITTGGSININSFRQTMQLQRWMERQARGGTRYTEVVRSHFGVTSPDSRLQRPEYLGGSSQRISINPVQQTSSTDSTTPQGNLAAYGQFADNRGGFYKSFTEHTVIIGLLSIRADQTYQQGINRLWRHKTVYDFYWPTFANLGEQEVLTDEIYFDGDGSTAVFGYQERYAEYRYYPNQVCGLFRSTAPLTLNKWHLAQKFDDAPTLSDAFIRTDTTALARCIAVPSQPHFMVDMYLGLKCARPMPVYSVPGMVDHF